MYFFIVDLQKFITKQGQFSGIFMLIIDLGSLWTYHGSIIYLKGSHKQLRICFIYELCEMVESSSIRHRSLCPQTEIMVRHNINIHFDILVFYIERSGITPLRLFTMLVTDIFKEHRLSHKNHYI